MVAVWYIWKALEKGVDLCVIGGRGGGWPLAEAIRPPAWTGEEFLAYFQEFHLGFHQGLVILSAGHPGTTPKTLPLGQTKAGNGFSTVGLGGKGIDTPSHASFGCQTGPVGGQLRAPTHPSSPQLTVNWPN